MSTDSAATTTVRSSPPDLTRNEIVVFFENRQTAYDNLNAPALAADYAPDCVIDSPAGGSHQGREAAQAVLQAIFDAFVDLKVRTDDLLIDGSRVAQALTIEGTLIGTFMGVAPTGKHFRCSGVFLYELRDGQIVHERRVYDFTGMLVQIGVLKAKPL